MTKVPKNNDLQWKFLKDDPIETEEKDHFKIHSAYAKTLFDIIGRCETPFSIGVFGSWGSGKTTVVKLLENLVVTKNKFKYLYFDVWKFSKEPLKRWILLEMEKQLAEKDDNFKEYKFESRSLKSHLEYEEEWQDETELKIDTKALGITTFLGIGSIVLAVIIFFIAQQWEPLRNLLNPGSGILAFSGLAILIFRATIQKFLDTFASSIFKKSVRNITAHPAFSAEKFVAIFKDMVQKATKTTPKLILVFDNIDRCPEDVALESISVIKTFLDEKSCVYIIPCDKEALVNHIIKSQAVENSKENQDRTTFAGEYLRKFFQVTIRLPYIPEFDREQFIDDQLKEANLLSLSPETRDIIAIAYGGKTPRQIKRFINDFIGYLTLVDTAEKEGLLPSGELTENLDFLAKIIVIYIEWPDFLDNLIEDPELLNEYTDKIRRGERIKQGADNQSDDKKLLEFLEATRDVAPPPDLRPYLYLKRVDYEKDTKLAQQVRENLAKGNETFFIEALEKESKIIEGTFRIASDVAKEWLRGKRTIFINNAIRIFLKTVERVPEDIKREFVSLTNDLLRNVFLREEATRILELFDEDKVFKFCRNLRPYQRESILDKYVDLLNPAIEGTEGYMKIYEKLVKERELLSSKQKGRVKELLPQRYTNEEKNTLGLIAIIVSTEAAQDFINSQLPLNIIEKFTVTPDDDNRERFKTYLSIRDFAGSETKGSLTTKIIDAVAFSKNQQMNPTNEFALEILNKVEPKDLAGDKSNDLYAQLKNHISNKPVPNRSPWAGALLRLRSFFNKDQQIELENNLVSIMNHPNVNEIVSFLDGLNEESRQTMLSKSKVKTVIRERTPQLNQQNKKQLLDKFPPDTLVRELFEIIDPEIDWDVSLGYEVLEKAYENGKCSPEEFAEKLKEFLELFIKDKLDQRSALLERAVTNVEGDNTLTKDEDLINILMDYVIDFMKINAEKASGLFSILLTHIPESRKSEKVLMVLDRHVKGKVSSGKFILESIVNLVEKNEVLKKRDTIEPLADYVFDLMKQDVEKGCELFRKLIPFMPENMKNANAKELINNLLLSESQGLVMTKFQSYFDVLKDLQESFDKDVWEKVFDLVERLLGPAKSGEERQIGLEFLRGLEKTPDDDNTKKRLEKLKKRIEMEINNKKDMENEK